MAKDNHRKSFVLYKSWITEIEKISRKQAGVLIMGILDYVNGNTVNMDVEILDLYNRIIEQIEFEWSKYNPKTEKFHWNYKGGITDENHLIRNSTIYKCWRDKVFKRDKWTCQHCDKEGGELNAHHIKHFATHIDLRFEVTNGLTLCKVCHIKVHSNE